MRLGILGGGQLGRMLALAAAPLGVRCTVVDASPDACAGHVAELIVASPDDPAALDRLAATCDAVTAEWENVPAAALERLARDVPTWPPAEAFAIAQDRVREKDLFGDLGIAVAPWRVVATLDELEQAVAAIGCSAFLKTRGGGYDGKGQARIAVPEDVGSAWRSIGGAPSILEGAVEFARELSVIAARATDGSTVVYPLTENVHRDGILRTSTAPAPGLTAELQARGEGIARVILDRLAYVGVLAVELFETTAGELIANEFAPRVHNSGHWTIDGAGCSQFSNHVRAVLGLPLGAVEPVRPTVMTNLIGDVPALADLAANPGRIHLYGKAARPGRKVGHVNVVG